MIVLEGTDRASCFVGKLKEILMYSFLKVWIFIRRNRDSYVRFNYLKTNCLMNLTLSKVSMPILCVVLISSPPTPPLTTTTPF